MAGRGRGCETHFSGIVQKTIFCVLSSSSPPVDENMMSSHIRREVIDVLPYFFNCAVTDCTMSASCADS